MKIKYNLPMLKCIADDLTQLTGIAISILDSERNKLVISSSPNDYCTIFQSDEENCKLCRCSDQAILSKCCSSFKLETHICHAGLYDAAMPILKGNTILGYVLFGRVRSTNSPKIPKRPPNNVNAQELSAHFQELPFFTTTQLHCLYDLLSHILFEKAIEAETDNFIDEATQYIDEHLNSNLQVSSLCKELNVSKNYLYRSFHKHLGQTLNEYITERRIDTAKSLLSETNDPVYVIGEKVGYDNYSYFCRVFKASTGISAIEYRKKVNI